MNNEKKDAAYYANELMLSEERLDELGSNRDEAVSEGKFDLVAELSIKYNRELDRRDGLEFLSRKFAAKEASSSSV